MFKLDFSHLHDNGFRINQLRLIHSLKFKGINFMKNKQKFIDNEDLTGERNLITEYIVESNEISYTNSIIFAGITVLMFFLLVLTLRVPNMSILLKAVPLVLFFVSWFISRKGKEDFVMGHVGLELSESIYNMKIKDKYNL